MTRIKVALIALLALPGTSWLLADGLQPQPQP